MLLGCRPDSGALLIGSRGGRLSRQWIFWTVRKMLGGRETNTKTLRTHFAMSRIREQTPLEELRKIMGHRSIETTKKYRNAVIIREESP